MVAEDPLEDNINVCSALKKSPRQFQKSLGVTCPFSMLRIQVVDQGNSNAVNRSLAMVGSVAVPVE